MSRTSNGEDVPILHLGREYFDDSLRNKRYAQNGILIFHFQCYTSVIPYFASISDDFSR